MRVVEGDRNVALFEQLHLRLVDELLVDDKPFWGASLVDERIHDGIGGEDPDTFERVCVFMGDKEIAMGIIQQRHDAVAKCFRNLHLLDELSNREGVGGSDRTFDIPDDTVSITYDWEGIDEETGGFPNLSKGRGGYWGGEGCTTIQ